MEIPLTYILIIILFSVSVSIYVVYSYMNGKMKKLKSKMEHIVKRLNETEEVVQRSIDRKNEKNMS